MTGRPPAVAGEPPQIIERVVRDHAEQAALAWDRRDRMRWHPAYRAADVDAVKALLADHLDGLDVAGAEAEPSVQALLTHHPSAGDLMVATWFAVQHDRPAVLLAVEEVLSSMPAASGGAASALLRSPPDRAARVATRWRSSDIPALRRAALSADVVRRGANAGEHIRYCVADGSPLVRARAWRAAAEFALAVTERPPADLADPRERAAVALWCAVRGVAIPTVDDALFADLPMRDALRVLTIVGTRMSAVTARQWSARWREHHRLQWYAPLVLALHGAAAHRDELVVCLHEARHNPVVGAALAHLTGVDAVTEQLLGVDDPTVEGASGSNPSAHPDDLFGPFDELPRWHVTATTHWWSRTRGDASPTQRILAGQSWRDAADGDGSADTELQRRHRAMLRRLRPPVSA